MRKLILMNSAMMPFEGAWRLERITPETAREIAKRANSIQSFIGYESTAKYMENVLGVEVPVNRSIVTKEDFQNAIAIVCKLKYRVKNPNEKGKFTPGNEDFEWYLLAYEGSGETSNEYSKIIAILSLLQAVDIVLSGEKVEDVLKTAEALVYTLKDENLKDDFLAQIDEIKEEIK